MNRNHMSSSNSFVNTGSAKGEDSYQRIVQQLVKEHFQKNYIMQNKPINATVVHPTLQPQSNKRPIEKISASVLGKRQPQLQQNITNRNVTSHQNVQQQVQQQSQTAQTTNQVQSAMANMMNIINNINSQSTNGTVTRGQVNQTFINQASNYQSDHHNNKLCNNRTVTKHSEQQVIEAKQIFSHIAPQNQNQNSPSKQILNESVNLNEVARQLLSGKNQLDADIVSNDLVQIDQSYNPALQDSKDKNLQQRTSIASTLDLPFIKKPVRIKEPRNKRTSNFDAVLANHYKAQQNQVNYAHLQPNEAAPITYIGGFMNRRPTQIRAKTEDLEDISNLQQHFPSPVQKSQLKDRLMMEENNIFYHDFNQTQDISQLISKPATSIAHPMSQERVARGKRRFINKDGVSAIQQQQHESVRVKRDLDGKINVIIDVQEDLPLNQTTVFNGYTQQMRDGAQSKKDQNQWQAQSAGKQYQYQQSQIKDDNVLTSASSKNHQIQHSKKSSFATDKKQNKVQQQLNHLNNRANDYYKQLENQMTRQHDMHSTKVKTPDISSGSFLLKDMQNYADMSFEKLGRENTNFLYQSALQQTSTNLDKHLLEANKLISHNDTQEEFIKLQLTQNSLDTSDGAQTIYPECQKSRKGFRIKFKGPNKNQLNCTQDNMLIENSLTPMPVDQLDTNRMPNTKRDTSQPRSALDKQTTFPFDGQNSSLIQQIRNKFNEQKYMKREDVLKLLKQIQTQEGNTDKGKNREVFDKTEIFKGLANFNQSDTKSFNMTAQQQQFMNLFKKEVKPRKTPQPQSSYKVQRKLTPPKQLDEVSPLTNNRLKLGLTTNFVPRIKEEVNKIVPSNNEPQRNMNPINQFQRGYTSIENSNKTMVNNRLIHVTPVKFVKNQGEKYTTTECDFEIVIPANVDEQQFLNEIDEDKINAMMKIGLNSLQKFESKSHSMPHQGVVRKVRHLQNAQTNGNAFLNALSAYSIARGIEPREATVLVDMIKADKFGLLTNDVNQLKKDLQEYYLLEKLAKGCISKQMPLQVRYQIPSPTKIQKSNTAAGQARKERKPINLFNNNLSSKMNKEDSFSELKQLTGIIDGCHQNNHTNMPETKIKVLLQPYEHLENSEINRVIRHINHFVFLVIKQRAKLNDNQYTSLFKFFGINPPKVNGFLDHQAFKNRDFMNQSNEKLLQRFYRVLNKENGNLEPLIGKSNLNYYVGKGNNFYLVRQIVKRRVWWTRSSKEDFSPLLRESEEGIPHFGCNFIWTQWKKNKHLQFLKMYANNNTEDGLKLYNRLEDNFHLSNKKALFRNITRFYRHRDQDPFELAIPLTFHICSMNSQDQDYQQFLKVFSQLKQQKDSQNVWIIKPGEDTNRGCGIHVSNQISEIQQILKSELGRRSRTMIVQKYIEKPLLVNGRKFDIRCFGLMTSINGYQKGFFYRDCYFRTSSKEYSIDNLSNKYIHLTNDAIQKNAEDYGKFENGNKMSINDFQRYLDSHFPHLSISFMRDIFSQMERLVTDTFRAVYTRIDPNRVKNCFELFGYDFMIDESFRVYLIEANTNPCLEISCPLLARIIPEVVDNTFTVAMDPLFQPGQFENQQDPQRDGRAATQQLKKRSRRMDLLPQIKYMMVFDEQVDGPALKEVLKQKGGEPRDEEKDHMMGGEDDEEDGKGSIDNDDEIDEDDDSDYNNQTYLQ